MTRRILWRIVVPLLTAFLLFVVPLGILGSQNARSQVIELVERRAASVAALAAGDQISLEDATVALTALPGLPGEAAGLVSLEGEWLPGGKLSGPVTSPTIDRALHEGAIGSEIDRSQDSVRAAAPVVVDGEIVAAAVVTLPDDAIIRRTRTTLLILSASSAVLMGAAVLAGRSLARTIVRPLESLDRVAGRLATGDLDARAEVATAPPELRRLAASLNRSAEETQRVLSLQRAFVADASHGLRTPLAGLRLQLENAQLAGGDEGGRLAAAITEVDRLAELVTGLLALARAEEGQQRPVPVDVAAIAAERVAAWSVVASGADVTITCTGPERALGAFVPGGLEQVLDNLLANALRASPDDASIDVQVREVGGLVTCTVADRGPGMTADQRAHAFERFWRASAKANGNGSGLGLPIVAELVAASGGSIQLLPREGGGLVAEVRIAGVVAET